MLDETEYQKVVAQKDAAYKERNALVCLLSKLYPSWLERHNEADLTWEDDWRWIVFMQLPTGQATWHIHDSEFALFDHLPVNKDKEGHGWDGHTTEEKYQRISEVKQICHFATPWDTENNQFLAAMAQVNKRHEGAYKKLADR